MVVAGEAASWNDTVGSAGCWVHCTVMVSSGSGSEAAPFMATVPPSRMVRSVPALTTGAELILTTVMVTVSAECNMPSVTLSWNSRVSGISGVVNMGDCAVASDSVTVLPDIWLHW